MKRSSRLLSFAVVISFLAFAVETNSQTPANFVVLHHGYDSLTFTKRQTKVITSQQEYAETLAAYSTQEPQQLDFTAGRVLLVDMGRRPTGGFSIEVTAAEPTKASMRVEVQLTKPGPACAVISSLTNPYQFVYVATKKEILISESLATLDCGGTP